MPALNSYSGCQLWIEADSLTDLANGDPLIADPADGDPGGNVAPFLTWPDRGTVEGTANDLYSQSDPDTTPHWYERVRCRYPAVRFEQTPGSFGDALATSSRLIWPGIGRTAVVSRTGYTAFSLFRVNRFTTAPGFNLWGRVDSSPQTGVAVGVVGSTLSLISRREDGLSSAQSVSSAITTDTWYLAETWWDGSALSLLVNGAGLQTVASGGPGPNSFHGVEIGAQSSGADWEFDLLGEVIYDEVRTPTQRDEIRATWQRKYGLAPYSCPGATAHAWILG